MWRWAADGADDICVDQHGRESDPAQATLNFYGDDGSPLSVTLTLPENPSATVLQESSFIQSIAPGASLWVVAEGATTLQTGSAQLATNGNVGGFAIFRYNTNGQEAVVPMENRNASTYFIPFDDTAETATGIAIANVGGRQRVFR